MSNLSKLWRLQILEEQQAKQNKGENDPKMLVRLKELKKQIESTQNKIREIKVRYQRAKDEAKDLAGKTGQLKSNCDQISEKIYAGSLHPKEIKSYQQRLDNSKRELAQSEDKELEVMQLMEDTRKEWEKNKKLLDDMSEQFKELHQTYLTQKDEIKSRAIAMTRETDELKQEISQDLFKSYQQLKLKFKNPVGRVTKDSCSGCHLGITFEKLKQLRYQETTVYCSNCGRMLFWDPQ